MKKSFKVSIVVSLTTGFLVCENFSEIQELGEWVLGHSVFTHEFADNNTWNRMKARLFEQHPILRQITNFSKPESDKAGILTAIAEYVEGCIKIIGTDALEVEGGSDTRSENPIASLERLLGGTEKRVVVKEPSSPGSN